MNRSFLMAVIAVAATVPGNGAPAARSPGLPVTIQVAVERATPLSLPRDLPGRPSDLPPITPRLVAEWTLETGLGPADFEVLVDSQPAPVLACVPATSPVSVVLLVDVTASMDTSTRIAWLTDQVRRAFIPALHPGDQAAIARVGGGLVFPASFSDNTAALATGAAVLLKPTSRDARRAFGIDGSPIWDGVDRAVTMLEPVPGRRAVVLVSDGRASANGRSLADVIAHAVSAGVGVSVVGTAIDETIRQGGTVAARIRSRPFLRRLASDTGAAYIDAFGPWPFNPWLADAKNIEPWLGCTLARAVDEVHGGYALTFAPPADDGLTHALTVTVKRPGLKVRAPIGCRVRRSR